MLGYLPHWKGHGEKMEIVTDKKTIDQLVKGLIEKIKQSKKYYKNNYTFGYRLKNKGAAGTGILRHILFFGYNDNGLQENLLEINIPCEYSPGYRRIQGRIVSDSDRQNYLIRSISKMTTPGRVDISNNLRLMLKNRILEFEEKSWIRVCSLDDFQIDDLVYVLKTIRLCRRNTYTDNDSLFEDIEKINRNGQLTETEKKQLTKARIGQGNFRDQLLEDWKGACAVTQCDEISVLTASHIKPWRDSNNKERLDKYNGLLLSPNIDRLFDKGFITFDDEGKIKISKSLSKKNIEKLGISKEMIIPIKSNHKKYMTYHRENVFQS